MISIACNILTFTCGDHIMVFGCENGLIYDSATRKSFLFTLLKNEQNLGKLESNCRVRLIDSPYTLAGIRLSAEDCIIIDELNFAPREVNSLLDEVRSANAYLIVIGRILIKQLEYSVDAIYTFHYADGRFTMKPYFQNSESQPFQAGIAACEDSTSVAAVYSRKLEDEVIPVRGRSNFYKFIKNQRVAFIIADKPKFGSDLLNLIYKVKTSGCKIKYLVMFLPDCFEEVVCEIANGTDALEDMPGQDQFFDREQYYEYLASAITKWDKNNVTSSVAFLMDHYDMDASEILEDMRLFYNHMQVSDRSRCYVVDLNAIDIAVIQPQKNGGIR